MPIYEYLCRECGTKFEAILSIKSNDQQMPCTKCKSPHTTRLISVFNAHSGGKIVSGTHGGSSCSGCAGGSCSTCGH